MMGRISCLLAACAALLLLCAPRAAAQGGNPVSSAVSTLTGQDGGAQAAATPSPAAPGLQDDAAIAAAMEEAAAKAVEAEALLGAQTALESAPETAPPGVGVGELQARTAALRNLLGAWQQRGSVLRELQTARAQLVKAEADRDGFTKLTEEPPHTYAFVDGIREEVAAKDLGMNAERMSLNSWRESLAGARKAAETAKTVLNQANEQGRGAATPEEKNLADFRFETARIELRAAEALKPAAEAVIALEEARIRRMEAEKELALRRLKAARAQALFRPQEMEEVRQRCQTEEARLDGEAQKVRRELERRRARVTELENRAAGTTDPAVLETLNYEIDTERARLETSQMMLDALEGLGRCEAQAAELWQLRFDTANPGLGKTGLSLIDIKKQAEERAAQTDADLSVVEQRARSLRAQIQSYQAKFDTLTPEDPKRPFRQRRLESLQERTPYYDRLVAGLSRVQSLAATAAAEAAERQSMLTPSQRLGLALDWARGRAAMVLDRELVAVGGESITARKLFYAMLILVAGFVFNKLFTRYLTLIAFPRLRLRPNIAFVVENLTKYALLFLVFYAVLGYLNISLTVFAFLGGAVAIGAGFGSQNLINNFISGLILMGEQPIRVGDIVEVDGNTGTITTIGARASLLRTFSGIEMLVPNSKFLENTVINWTLSDSRRRFDVAVGVAYGSPVREASKLMMRAAVEHGNVLKDPEPVVVFEEFGDSAEKLTLYFWVELTKCDSRVVRSDLRFRIEKMFEEAGVVIAYPQHDVHLHTADPVGVRLLPAEEKEPPAAAGRPHLP